MGRIPNELREQTGRNIRKCREERYPERGGGKRCAEDLSKFVGRRISPQQWSLWERGARMPEEPRLLQIARFFGKTVEWMRGEHTQPQESDSSRELPLSSETELQPHATDGQSFHPSTQHGDQADAYPGHPGGELAPTESLASIFWLNRYFYDRVLTQGITVRLDPQSIDAICERLKMEFGD